MPSTKSILPSDATYTISPLSTGFIAQCEVRPEISVYGETRTEALEKIELAITEYEKIFKKRAK